MTLTEVKPYSEKTRKFRKFETNNIRKTDYLKKTTEDMKTGLLGEKIILEYEESRLKNIGLDDYEVKWISKESDAFGYDIISYDKDEDGRIHEIYIEVKSMISVVDIDFFVSKNEVETSNKFDQKYYIYRLFDCKSVNPKFYRAKGKLEQNFILDPVTYQASYKWKVQ